MIPKYGIVHWRDATGKPDHVKNIKPTRLTKNLPINETIGWLFQDAEGTIAVVQERVLGTTGLDRQGEFTLVPAAWVIEIIILVVEEKTNAVHREGTAGNTGEPVSKSS